MRAKFDGRDFWTCDKPYSTSLITQKDSLFAGCTKRAKLSNKILVLLQVVHSASLDICALDLIQRNVFKFGLSITKADEMYLRLRHVQNLPSQGQVKFRGSREMEQNTACIISLG